MVIAQDCAVALSYQLTVDNEVVDSATPEQPLEFIFGHNQLLPMFEDNIAGMAVNDTFDFFIPCKDGYGEVDENSVVALPKDIFIIDGTIQEDLLVVGKRLPMRSSTGDLLYGNIVNVLENEVIMDFNHPMAGKDLHFTGKVVNVRQATENELCGGGCSSGCCGDCSCH